MRRALALLFALFMAGPASAKVMIVVDQTIAASTTPPSEHESNTAVSVLTSVLSSYPGSQYTFVPANIAKTEFCRTGLMVWNYGTARAYTEQFDAVIHANFNGSRTSSFSGYRPDSICMNAKAPTVPQLILPSASVYSAATNSFYNSTSCSLGVVESFQTGAGAGNHEGEGTVYENGQAGGWFDIEYAITHRRGTIPSGGIRVMLTSAVNSFFVMTEESQLPTQNADSCGRSADPDTMLVWERLNNHRPGLSRVVAASVFASFGVDSATQLVSDLTNQSVNWPVLMYALGHLDSLAGGRVLGDSPPVKIAFTINGVGNRGKRTDGGGVFSADTTVLKATCDSLFALGVPLTLFADPESLTVNMGDVEIWKRAGQVRFSPWTRVGMDTTVAGLGNASFTRPVDIFGRYRNRAFYGDSTYHFVVGADSSIASLLLGAKRQLSLAVGSNYLSSFIAAPGDDWSPKNMNAASFDSLIFAMRVAGFSAVQIQSNKRDSDPGYRRPSANADPIVNGWMGRQARVIMPLSPFAGQEFRFLGHNGVSPAGSKAYNLPGVAVMNQNVAWGGFFMDRYRSGLWWPEYGMSGAEVGVTRNIEWYLYGLKKARIVALSSQSLAGGDTQYPGRPGWYVVKHITNAVRAINRAAGRPIMSIVYAEDATP